MRRPLPAALGRILRERVEEAARALASARVDARASEARSEACARRARDAVAAFAEAYETGVSGPVAGRGGAAARDRERLHGLEARAHRARVHAEAEAAAAGRARARWVRARLLAGRARGR